MAGRFSINVNDNRCPFGEPVSVVDESTRQIVGCHKTVIDAQKHRALLEEDGESTRDPDVPTVAFTTPASRVW